MRASRDPAALTPLPEPTPWYWPWLMVLLLLALMPLPALLLLPGWLGLPRYEVAGGEIVARSLASRTVIPAGTPVEAGPVTLRGRQIGSETPGYVVGRFNSSVGTVAVYGDGSQDQGALLFMTRPLRTLLTPADPEALLEAWRGGDNATFRPARAAQPGSMHPLLLLLLLSMLPSLWVLLRRPRLSYRLVGDALEVRTAISRTRFPLAGTEASLTTASLGTRTFGTARPGYYTGTFITQAGTVQAAASQKAPAQALLLRHAGKTHYLTPARPEVVAGWFGSGTDRPK